MFFATIFLNYSRQFHLRLPEFPSFTKKVADNQIRVTEKKGRDVDGRDKHNGI